MLSQNRTKRVLDLDVPNSSRVRKTQACRSDLTPGAAVKDNKSLG